MADRDTQITGVQVSGSNVSGDSATVDFTSDKIPMPQGAWSLNAYTDSLTHSGIAPTYTIYVSNDGDSDGLKELDLRSIDIDIEAEKFVYKSSFPGQFMVIIYSSNGATGGTVLFKLFIKK